MKFLDYIKDKFFEIIISFIFILLVYVLLICFNCNQLLIISILFLHFVIFLSIFSLDFFRKKFFYDKFDKVLNNLDNKYFITEIVKESSFLEGRILLECLYEINKNYIENINTYKFSNEEFKEYIELWCHEIKTPVATSKLIINNNKNNITDSILEEIDRIEYFIEQVLYYARSDSVDKDYSINDINLKNIVNTIIKNNKKDFINKKIKIHMFNENVIIKSDEKWISYIINQIITNSIKYCKSKDSYIRISVKSNINNKILYIEDNGIGINSNEIDKVFKRGFTGSNGRKITSSTGMGLFLCKKLCDALGYNINISSKEGVKTVVSIVFPNSSMLNNLTK